MPLFPICRWALCVALVCQVTRAEALSPELIARLRAYHPETSNLQAFLAELAPKLAPELLQLGTTEIQRGGPLHQTLGPGVEGKLDAAPESLPMVVYKKEEGRLPAAFILARHRGVLPSEMVYRFGLRNNVLRHPLISQYFELTRPTDADPGPWGADAIRRTATSFSAVDMPFGAGLFGLRPSYVFGEWEYVTLPNGVCMAALTNRPARPDEKARLGRFNDKKGRERTLDGDYYEAREYRLTNLLLPERDETGRVRNTVQVYFVRIVPALKPGTDLRGSGALARWLFARGAQEAVIVPVKLTREQVAREQALAHRR